MKDLTHVNARGKAEMVDISSKKDTVRTAAAEASVLVSEKVYGKIKENEIAKGDVLSIAEFAGIQAAKRTSELIPLCHNIPVTKVSVELKLNETNKSVEISAFAKTTAKTGIEMEALTAVSVAALTVYDMCKALDKSIKITDIRLLSKTGGKSGDYRAG